MTEARLFLALWPGAREREAVRAWQMRLGWPPCARLVRPENLHLTLHFIGAVARERLPELADGLAVPMTPFELEFDRVECWAGGLTVLRPASVPDALLQLHARLATALQRLALPVETRAFKPHVTLARRATGVRLEAPLHRPRWRAAGYVLAESAGGYRVLHRHPA